VVLLIGIFTLTEAWPALQHIGLVRFFTDSSWHPTENLFNALPMLVGSLAVVIGAIAVIVPVGILIAIYVVFYANKSQAAISQRIVEIMAGIPSVVYGLWGLLVIVPIVNQWTAPGTSLLAGIIVLTCMVVPGMTLIAISVFKHIATTHIQNAVSLGLPKSSIILDIVLPLSRPGLISGAILQTGRAIGETMAVLMVVGNVVQLPSSIFDPIRTLTSSIALETAYALGDHRAALFVSGLILIMAVVLLIVVAQYYSRESKLAVTH
jgi:phosphate transport system permease protein